MDDDRPKMDDRDPADAIDQMVSDFLRLADTWTAWDGNPIPIQTAYGQRLYTPNKALRRATDHMVDHLAQLQAHIAGQPSIQDEWKASRITTGADLAPITAEDLEEFKSRFLRLGLMWRTSLASVAGAAMDQAERDEYTPREMAFHTLETMDYANYVGDLSQR